MLNIQELHKQLCDHAVPRSMRLQILRGLNRKDVCSSSLKEALTRVIGAELEKDCIVKSLGTETGSEGCLQELAGQFAQRLCSVVH